MVITVVRVTGGGPAGAAVVEAGVGAGELPWGSPVTPRMLSALEVS